MYTTIMSELPRTITFGSWVDGMDADPSLLNQAADDLTVDLSIASIFRGIEDTWPYPNDAMLGDNRTLLVSWHLSDLADFAYWSKGKGDKVIRSQAKRIKNYGKPVVIRPWAEMNADWVDFQPKKRRIESGEHGGTYAEFIAAWRRVVTIMRSEGVSNVKWAFNPTTDTYAETTHPKYIYPGDEYVDYLALDGYNWGDGDGLTWRTFTDIYQEQYARLTAIAPTKPVWIAEIGSSDPESVSASEAAISAPAGASKSEWWINAVTSIKNEFPQIEAIVLFDAEKERDWRRNSSQTALDGLKAAIALGNLS